MGVSDFLFYTLPSIFQNVIDGMSAVVDTLSQSASDVVYDFVDNLRESDSLGIIGDAVADFLETGFTALLNVTGLDDVSILSLMVGAGIVFYVGYQFITWVANIIT